MSEGRPIRIGKAAREFNISAQTIIAFLAKKGHDIDGGLNAKLSPEQYGMLANEYESDRKVKEKAESIELAALKSKNAEKEDVKPADDTVHHKNQEKATDAPVSEDLMIKKTTMASPAPNESKDNPITEPKPDSRPEEQKKESEKPTTKVDVAEQQKPETSTKEVPKEQPTKKKEVAKEEKEVTAVKEDLIVEPKAEKTEKKAAVEESPEKKKTETKAQKPKSEKKVPVEEEPAKESKVVQQAEVAEESGPKVLGTIDLSSINQKTKPAKKSRKERRLEQEKNKSQHKPQKPAENTKKPATQGPDKKEAVKPKEEPKAVEKKEEIDENFIPTEVKKLTGPKILDKIVLPEKKKPEKKKPVASSSGEMNKNRKKKRKRIRPNGPVNQNQQQGGQQQGGQQQGGGQQRNQDRRNQRNKPARGRKKEQPKVEPTAEEIQQKVRETLTKLTSSSKSKGSKHRRAKREQASQVRHEEMIRQEEEKKVLKVTEFVTANELATMMDVQVNNIISACMSLGLFVSINQRLDAETITVVAEEFGYTVEFVSVEVLEAIDGIEEEEDESKLESRAPIVTVMGHVDHGKTKLLDYIRNANVVAGEAGGITQHIGAYEVTLDDGRKITFLDTPGHEAFTAMRARGAQVTDVAIIVIAADDSVMPQTKEAINHASAAGVPIVFAINKIDKPTANVERIKEQLANMNYLVEDWGGKYQSQEISAKAGINIDELLEKVLLESEMLDLKANPNRLAKGAIIESSLDKGRGYVSKMLVQSGTMHIGDTVLAGSYFGKVKAMYNQFNEQIKEAGPSTPVLMLGLNGAPGAGDAFNVMKEEREAKNIATKRLQLQREQGLRTQKHITLDEIGRRIAIGDFQELNVIVKGDVQGSVEALTDAILKLSTDEVQVNVVHQAVGQIVESDVLLASASNAVIIGFQVRPSVQARRLAEAEQIDIRLYSIIYQALEELKSAIEGLLAPKIEEKIIGNLEVREIFKISKVGTIAGCFAIDGKVQRTSKVRVIRDGIVVYTGLLGSLRRFKDDVKEVIAGQDCGMNIENFNDIKVGDIIEGYEEYEIKRKL